MFVSRYLIVKSKSSKAIFKDQIVFFYVDIIYRVSGLSCPEAGGCKSAILRGFPDVFGLFEAVPFLSVGLKM